MPYPDHPGDSGPSYTSPETEVHPGNLDQFATFLDELASYWDGQESAALTMDQQEPGSALWPKFGTFEAAQKIEQAYTTAHGGMQTSVAQLHALLSGLADASRKIADTYRNAEALAGASVSEVESVLAEHVTVPTPDPAGSTGNGSQPGDSPSDSDNPSET